MHIDTVRPRRAESRLQRLVRRHRHRSEAGEGVVSTAIAVLVMAFLGVGMWVAFNATFSHAEKNVDTKVNGCIGQAAPGTDC